MGRFRDDPVIARAAPFLVFIALLMLGSALPADFSVLGLPVPKAWIILGRGIAIALLLAWFWRGYTELRRPGSSRPSDWLLAVAAGIAVFVAWVWLDQDWAVLSRAPGFAPDRAGGGIDWWQALTRLAGLALVVPVMEELFWRSLVLRWIERHDFLSLDPKQVGLRAFLITTALFSVEHDRWFAGAIAGAVYNWLYMRSGNLWVPIVAHAVTNGVLGAWILYTGRWEFW